MRAGRGAVPPDSPTSPKTPRREGEAWSGGCAGAAEALPPACPAETETEACPLPALCPNVPDVAACGGGGLFGAMRWRGGWLEVETEWAGGGLGWSAHAPPAPCFPLPAPHSPTDGGRGAERAPPRPHATLSPTIPDGSYSHPN